MDSARVLREARRRAGLSQRALAGKAGVPQSAIARIEAGRIVPRVDTLDRLLESCGEGLYAMPRIGIGVDRTLAQGLLASSPGERVHTLARARRIASPLSLQRRFAGVVREGERAVAEIGPILRLLREHEVRFVVIGGVAANARGSPMLTFDFDICYGRDRENVARLARALGEMGAIQRGVPEGLPNVVDERLLWNGTNFTFQTIHGPFDCLGEPAGTRGFPDLVKNATEELIEGTRVLVASLEDLVRMKRAAGRPKDLLAVEELGALQDVIDEEERQRRRRDRPG